MSLLTEAYLLDKYGPLLTHKEVATVLKMSEGTLRNRRSALSIQLTPIEQFGQIVFTASEVAGLIDEARTKAAA